MSNNNSLMIPSHGNNESISNHTGGEFLSQSQLNNNIILKTSDMAVIENASRPARHESAETFGNTVDSKRNSR